MEASNEVHPSLPANYVTLLDLRERWMKQQKQKKRDEDDGGNGLERNFEVQDDLAAEGEDEGVVDYNKLEEQHKPPEKSLLRSNLNPKSSTRRLSHGHRRPIETSNFRWIQVSQPNSPPVVEIVEAKVPQSPWDSPKVESDVEPCGEIRSSGIREEEEKKKKPKGKKKKYDEKKVVVQLQQGFEVGRGNEDGDDNTGAEIEGKLEGFSLSSGTGEKSGGKSMAVRNRRGLWKEKEGDNGKFENGVMLKKERGKREGGLIWVKKGEAS